MLNKPKKIPTRLEKHGHVRVDDYYWLRERDNPEVMVYLNSENEYLETALAHIGPLEDKLFEEIKARFKQTDMSVPYKQDGYYYYHRYQDGKEYPLYARRKDSLEGFEEIMLDANELARGHEYFSLGAWAVSSSQDTIAYAIDTQGRRIYTIHFKNLLTGADSALSIVSFGDAIRKLRELSPLWEMFQEGIDLESVQWAAH